MTAASNPLERRVGVPVVHTPRGTSSQAPSDDDAHRATYVGVKGYPNLVSTICSCGQSAYGASQQASAEAGFAAHVARPDSNTFRDATTTEKLFGSVMVAIAAEPTILP